MRIFAIPLALALAFFMYLSLPALSTGFERTLLMLYRHLLRPFTRRDGRVDTPFALAIFLLLLAGAGTLLGTLHPLVGMLVAFPLFSGLAQIPVSADVKRTLDSGACAKDAAAYETRVRETCAALAPAFIDRAFVPLLLLALGMPLMIAYVLGWAYAGLLAVEQENAIAPRILRPLRRAGDAVFTALMLLCAGITGRNPFRTTGRGAQARLVSILGITGDGADTHAPVSGDIVQGAFLCGFCLVLLCLLLMIPLLVLCR